MAELGVISDETYGEAGALIRAVAGQAERPEVEVRPGFEQMVAGAALALSEGAPNEFWDGRPSRAEDYLAEGREEWRHFHVAVARAIDIERNQPGQFETPGDVMGHIVGDVMTQARARRMALAIENTDPAFEKHLSNASRDTVRYAREDKEVADLIRAEARGEYSRFDPASRQDIANNIMNGEYVREGSRKAIEIAERAIDAHLGSLREVERERDSRLADHQDFASPLFPKASEAHWERASQLTSGERQPSGDIERGIVAHAALEEHDRMLGIPSPTAGMSSDIDASDRMAAYARALARGEEAGALHVGASIHAARIEADVVGMHRLQENAMEGAYEAMQSPQDNEVAYQRGLLALAAGHIEWADPQTQASAFAAIRDLDGVAPLRVMDLSFAAAAVERGDLAVGIAREAKEAEARRSVSYEGDPQIVLSLREQDQRWRDDLYLPGDRVRINDQVSVAGVDRDALHAKLGPDALEVERTVVRGDMRSNGLGGTYEAAFPEYEFKGHEGRFPANQFQHERGDEHHYGAMLVKDDRLWFVPMGEDLDNPKVTGEAREVTATAGSVEGMKSIAEARDFFRGDDASGEFVVRPEAFGRKEGPVELVGTPWMSSLSEAEGRLAREAVAKVEVADPARSQPLGAMVGAAMAGQGR